MRPMKSKLRTAASPVAEMQASRRAELERLLNDPEVPIQPDRVWSLVFEIAQHEQTTVVPPDVAA